MPLLQIQAGSTSQSVNIFCRDSSSATGQGLAAIATAGGTLLSGTKLDYSFTGANAARVNVSLTVLATVGAAYSSGGIVSLDNTNMIGWVRVDLPNAALAGSSGRMVSFLLWGGTNLAPVPFNVELTATNNQSANAFITGVNSLAPPTNWNLMSIDASGRVIVASIANGAIAAATFAANALDAVWSTATRLLTAGTNIVLAKGTGVTGFNDIAQSAILSDATPFAGANIALIQAKTTNLPASPASTTNITAGTITTVTNLTNAPTAGDFTTAMKTSLNNATPVVTLAASAVTAIWGALTTALTTAGSIGKFLVDSLTGNTPQTGDAYLALTGAQSEPGQGAPAVNASPLVKLSFLYKSWRNKIAQTSSTFSLFDDAGVTVDQKASVGDDGSVFTRGEVSSGP